VRLPVVILECLRNTIEVPLLGFGVVSPSSHPDVVGTVALNDSVEWKLRDQVEWSVDMETEVFVETLSLVSLGLIEINDLPLLMSTFVVTPNTNWVSFFILSSFDIKDFATLPVDELVVLILEDLPPS